MANPGIGIGTILSGIVGIAVVIVAYEREYGALWARRRELRRADENRDEDAAEHGTASTGIVERLRERWGAVRTASTAAEIVLAFAVVPIVLLSIEATVQTRPWVLPLTADSITDPETAMLAYTSSFVHAGPAHLRGNVLGYLLIMSALYPLAVQTGKKRHLVGVSVGNLLAIPLVTGQLSLLLPLTGATLGFSSVNTAFLGSLLLFVFFAWNTDGGEVNPLWAVGPALVSLALAFSVAPLVFPYMPPLGEYALALGLLGGLLAVCFFRRMGRSALRRVWLQDNPILYWSVAVLFVGFARFLVFVPPKANLLAHLGGFYVGFFGLFAVVVGHQSRKLVRTTRALGEGL